MSLGGFRLEARWRSVMRRLIRRVPCLSISVASLLLIYGVLGLTAARLEAAPEDKERWNEKYRTETYIYGTAPISFLREHIGLLPKGKALDIAMGEGRNGVYLATQGFEVTGLDISEDGLRKAHALAAEHGVRVETKVVDLEGYQLPADTYDVIVCTYYLQRDLFPQIKRALKRGGMAVVETYTHEYVKYRSSFPRRYLLEPNELIKLFEGMRVIRYQDRDDGQAAYASILVQKP
jgi:SAM-dependent methyltransferase